MHNKKNFKYLILLIFFVISCADKSSLIYNSNQLIDYKLRRPSFWISKVAKPDKIIMNKQNIKEFNREIINMNLVKDLLDSKIFNKKNVYNEIKSIVKNMSKRRLYFIDGRLINKYFYKNLLSNIDLEIYNDIKFNFAFITRFSNQKLLPTDRKFFNKRNDFYFDRNQNNGLDIGTPVVVAHTTKDKKWCYVLSEYSNGWVKSKNIVKASRNDIELLNIMKKGVIISNKADLFADRNLTDYIATARMGDAFIYVKELENLYEILLPYKDKYNNLRYKRAYINSIDINKGYLPLTQRNIIKQAFKLINNPYGWGDMGFEQDCSKFIQQIFLSFGIKLPRNSYAQSLVGKNIYNFNKNNINNKRKIIAKDVIPGLTIMYMPGHIMLYTGKHNGDYYVIHAIYQTEVKIEETYKKLLINKVEVTPLNWGKNTLFNRIEKINLITK